MKARLLKMGRACEIRKEGHPKTISRVKDRVFVRNQSAVKFRRYDSACAMHDLTVCNQEITFPYVKLRLRLDLSSRHVRTRDYPAPASFRIYELIFLPIFDLCRSFYYLQDIPIRACCPTFRAWTKLRNSWTNTRRVAL